MFLFLPCHRALSVLSMRPVRWVPPTPYLGSSHCGGAGEEFNLEPIGLSGQRTWDLEKEVMGFAEEVELGE